MSNYNYNGPVERKRAKILAKGTPVFSKFDISLGFNCIGCRKHFKEGNRMMVTYHYKKDEGYKRIYQYERNLGKVCSDVCYTMACMKYS